LCAVLVISACEGWPPDSEKHEANFLKNQKAFEELERKMLATDYRYGYGYRDGDKILMMFHKDIYNEKLDGYQIQRIRKEDSEWTDLVVEARVLSIEQHDGVVGFEPAPARSIESLLPFLRREDRMSFTRIIHSDERAADYAQCKADYENLACGDCAVPLVDGWFIRYWWSPDVLVPEALDLYVEGNMSEEEYEKLADAAFEECRKAGAEAIGHKTSRSEDL